MSSTSSQPNPETNTESDSASSSGSSSSPSSSLSSTSSGSSETSLKSIDLNSLDSKQLEGYVALTKMYDTFHAMMGVPLPLLMTVPGSYLQKADTYLSKVALFVLTNGKRKFVLEEGGSPDYILGTDLGQKLVDLCVDFSNRMVLAGQLAETLKKLSRKNPGARFAVDDDGNITMKKKFEDLGDDKDPEDPTPEDPTPEPVTESPPLNATPPDRFAPQNNYPRPLPM